MAAQIIPGGRIEGAITAPASKSYAQRAIAAALLADGESVLTGMGAGGDIEAALRVARDLGAEITCEGDVCRIRGGLHPRSTRLNIGESGLSARLFVPVASLTDLTMTVDGTGSILHRPVAMMEAPLQALGVQVHTNGGYLPISVRGPIHGGKVAVDGSLSSQFVTGLLMALPLATEDTLLHVESLKSRPYIDMTLDVLNAFRVSVRNDNYETFSMAGGQRYEPASYNIEGDWSGASCLLVAGATAGRVTIRNLNPVSMQADTAIIHALAKAGAEIITTGDTVTVHRNDLFAFEFDATHCPDLFPALVALGAACTGVSEFKGTDRLKHKESNRAETLIEVFGALGVGVEQDGDTIRVTGGPVHAASVSSHNDHRIAMAAAVAALRSKGRVEIRGAEAVEKSYPGFWEDLASLRET